MVLPRQGDIKSKCRREHNREAALNPHGMAPETMSTDIKIFLM